MEKLSEQQKIILLKAVLDTDTYELMSKKEREEYFELNESNILLSKGELIVNARNIK